MKIDHNWKNYDGKKDVYQNEALHFWRYLSIADFITLLTTREIRFSRIDSFNDPIEGMTYNEIKDYQYWSKKELSNVRTELKKEFENSKKNRPKQIKKRVLSSQKMTFASCWHFEEYESLAMWNSYASGEGIAIKIENPYLFDYLIKAMETKKMKGACAFFGRVKYFPLFPLADEFRVSYGKPPEGKTSYFKKQWSYRHEDEYRFLIVMEKKTNRKSINFNLDESIFENIEFIAHPEMKPHKIEAMNNVLAKLGFTSKLQNSAIPMKKALYYF